MTDADAAKAGLLDHICHDEGSACPSCADFRAAIAAIEALQAENERLQGYRSLLVEIAAFGRCDFQKVRAALTTQEKPMTDTKTEWTRDMKTDWERRADLEAEERRMKQIAEADALAEIQRLGQEIDQAGKKL